MKCWQVAIMLGFTFNLLLTACLPPTPTPTPTSTSVNIPLDAPWEADGAVNSKYQDGSRVLETNLRGGDDFAELFLDLRQVDLPSIEQNQNRTYNLAGSKLTAVVRSDQDFSGDPNHKNGAQFLLKSEKNGQWDTLVGDWLNVSDAMLSPTGMEVFYKVPDEGIAREVAGISIKFTIGSDSNESYKGSFFIDRITIEKE